MGREDGLVLGIDIGSARIDTVLADVGNQTDIIVRGVGRSVTTGISNGEIVKPVDLVGSIDRAIKRAEREIGVRPHHAMITVPPFRVQSGHSAGLTIPKQGVITHDDKATAIHKAKKSIKSQDQLVLHAFPVGYTVDGAPVDDPIGKSGPLEVTCHFVQANAKNVNALLQVTQSLGLHVAGMVFSPIASSQLILSEVERREGALLIDIGARSTSVSLFKSDILQSVTMIPVGGETISADVAHCLGISPLEADRIKTTHGSVALDQIAYRDRLDVVTLDRGRIEIRREYMCQIVYARLKELMTIIGRRVGITPAFPYDIVITGGTSRLDGVAALGTSVLGHPVRVGPPEQELRQLAHADYSTALGLIRYGIRVGAIVAHEGVPNWLERLNMSLSRWF